MHGNPLTKYDNRDFWNHHKLEDFGLVGEVYLTTDFTKCMYFSDTGRTWEADKYNIKDVIPEGHASIERPMIKGSTDLIKILDRDRTNIYLLIHPERWAHDTLGWAISFAKDMAINTAKSILKQVIKIRKDN